MADNIVLVEWVDSNILHGWSEGDSGDNIVAHCRTVGILKTKNSEKVTLVFGDSDCGLVLEMITIPAGCITSIRRLRVR